MALGSRYVRSSLRIAAASMIVVAMLVLDLGTASATLGSGNSNPSNCGSPCYTTIYKTYSPTSKWARAEWIGAGSGSEGLAAVAGCQSLGGSIAWPTTTYAHPWTARQVSCSSPYNYKIIDNGYAWTPSF